MRAVILAAGKGERLQDVVQDVPKPMVDVGGMPVLLRTLLHLRQCGVTEIVITVGHLRHKIMEFFGDGHVYGVQICYAVEDQLLGTAGGVRHAVPLFKDKTQPVIVWHGDNYSTCRVDRMMEYHRRHRGAVTIAVCWRANVGPSSTLEWTFENRITYFEEKPYADRGRRVPEGWISAGMYVLDPDEIATLPEQGDFGRDVFPKMLVDGKNLYAYGFRHDEWLRWYDTPEILATLQSEYENYR